MQFKLFTIPIFDSGAITEEMNRFLRGNKILDVERQLINDSSGAYWCFCINYLERNAQTDGHFRANKVDYRQVLDEATFEKFSKLRAIRKQVAADEGIPAFAVQRIATTTILTTATTTSASDWCSL